MSEKKNGLIQAIVLVTALFAQGITIFAYMKSEIEDIASVRAQEIINVELEKREPLYDQLDHRLKILELDKVRKDITEQQVENNRNNIRETRNQIDDLESLQENNFRSILKERRRIDQLEQE